MFLEGEKSNSNYLGKRSEEELKVREQADVRTAIRANKTGWFN